MSFRNGYSFIFKRRPPVSIDRGTLAEAFGSDLETYYSRELMHIVGTGPK